MTVGFADILGLVVDIAVEVKKSGLPLPKPVDEFLTRIIQGKEEGSRMTQRAIEESRRRGRELLSQIMGIERWEGGGQG